MKSVKIVIVSAAMLHALGETGLIDLKARVVGLDGDDEIHRGHAAGYLAAEIDQPVAGIAGQRHGGHQEPMHSISVISFRPNKSRLG